MTEQAWQSAVDSNLVKRLMRPLVQPGAIGSQLGDSILARTEQMTSHLPLLVQFAQRQAGIFQPEQIPIVYAQPSSSVQVVHSQIETASEPLTIVQATLVSNSTLNDYTSNTTNLSIGESRQEYLSNDTSNATNLRIRESRQENLNNYTSNATNLKAGELRREPEFLMQAGSTDAIASSSPPRSSSLSSQNLAIVYAQNISKPFQSDLPNQMLTVHPRILGNPKLQSHPELRDSGQKPLPQVTPTRPKKSDPPASTSPPILTIRTGTEAAPPATPWQTRNLNETATTLPIVFAQPNLATPLATSEPSSRTPPELAQFSEFTSSFPPVTDTSPPPAPPINLDILTTQVERKILRRLVVESERRGQTRWR
ncbi:MAG: hypothetical protein MUC48_19575 [Leptolyngbya sp. Prado105]|jgi:hypothetical protein|nr:hypothetical protein [Leptolyngbya sp. Prado105]